MKMTEEQKRRHDLLGKIIPQNLSHLSVEEIVIIMEFRSSVMTRGLICEEMIKFFSINELLNYRNGFLYHFAIHFKYQVNLNLKQITNADDEKEKKSS